MTSPSSSSAVIMIVDDTPANLAMMEDMLVAQGYGVRCFPRGRLALAAASAEPPNLVLLDVNMPEMNGYEVCAAFKTDPRLADIPIIFVSALNDTTDQVKAFNAGGVDYVTKPLRVEEVLARVKTHLDLHRLQQELERQNARLDELVSLKTRQLAEAHQRLAILDEAKSDFLRLISHELRTPLHGLFSVGDLLFDACPPASSTQSLKDLFQQSRDRLLTIVDDALLLTQITTDASAIATNPAPLRQILRTAAGRVAAFASSRKVQLAPIPDTGCVVRVDAALCVRALQALLETAVKFSSPGETVRLAITPANQETGLVIEAAGRDIPAQTLPKIFQLLAISEAIVPGGDLGLAAPLARRILRLFGGEVTVENLVPPGVRFTVQFSALKSASNPDSNATQTDA